ncbi:DJ-1/PfpI family protein [Chthonobacter albigriseus]|uniref:DJ-1/PfpI family protein n=1 Tax=Chthonobacter albigriseus TaxID=1683161 RepID=UPI0015EF88D2|nr:DJ-1/PfpI family protein [Chthonobacter albigriseus]
MTGKRIAVVLLDAFADWEIGLFGAAARTWAGGDVRHVTPGGATVRSMGGLAVTPAGTLADLASGDHDALVIIGSSLWEAPDAPDIGGLVRADLATGIPVGAICGGTLAVARAGVLAERRHTSNAAGYLTEHVPNYGGAARYVDTPRAVVDGGLVTAPGSAPATFATAMIGLIWPGHPLIDQIAALTAAEHRSG